MPGPLPRRMSRRERLVVRTAAIAGVFVVAVAAVVWTSRGGEATYRPGQEHAGLTSVLDRPLPEDHPRVTFVDATEEAGITFRHFGGTRTSQLPEDMGSGAAWGDYDGDGWLDLYVVNVVGPADLSAAEVAASPARAHLYRNQGDGTFVEVAEAAGVDHRGWGMGAAWGDYDGDGSLDLVVTAWGRNVLYHNQGDGTFRDVTREAGLAEAEGFWAGAVWGDYDRDGNLDLYITGYVRYEPVGGSETTLQYDVESPANLNPSSFPPERNLLYRNRGDGTFEEVASPAGVLGEKGRGLGAVWADFDGDGWLDLYVANDVSDNALYRNLGDGTFADVSHRARVADYRGAMGLAVGDWDGDADLDLFVTHWIAQENALYTNLSAELAGRVDQTPGGAAGPPPPVQFADEADRHGLGQVALDYVGWGTAFLDYDNDGRLDLFVVNGSTLQEPDRPEALVPMRDQLFWNRGPEEGFYETSAVAGEYFGRELVGRGAAFADYDADGDVDVFVVNHAGRGVLLRNDGGNEGGWLQVRLRGRESNVEGLGARLVLYAGDGSQVRQIGAQSSYLSQNAPVAHFGLGESAPDSLVVEWPSGLRQTVVDLDPRSSWLVVEGGEAVRVDPHGVAGRAGGSPPGRTEPSKAAVLRFWDLQRAATGHRVAGRWEAAARDYGLALEIDPDHEDALYYLGATRLRLGDAAGAKAAWERLVAVNPSSARGHSQLGALHACPAAGELFDPARAEAAHLRAREINSEQTGPLLRLAAVSVLRDDHRGANRRLDAVLGSDPGSAEAWFLKGYVAWREGDRARARELYERAVAAARPVRAPGEVSGEGDTRGGIRPLLAADDPCPGLGPGPGELDGDAAGLAARMEKAYRSRDRLLKGGSR